MCVYVCAYMSLCGSVYMYVYTCLVSTDDGMNDKIHLSAGDIYVSTGDVARFQVASFRVRVDEFRIWAVPK